MHPAESPADRPPSGGNPDRPAGKFTPPGCVSSALRSPLEDLGGVAPIHNIFIFE